MMSDRIPHFDPFTWGSNFKNPALGFDKLFESIQRHAENIKPSFPYYNIRRSSLTKDDPTFVIEIALAGYSKDDVTIEVRDGTLHVSGQKNTGLDAGLYMYRGISFGDFSRRFALAENVQIKGADFKDGLLTIHAEYKVPEKSNATKINIS